MTAFFFAFRVSGLVILHSVVTNEPLKFPSLSNLERMEFQILILANTEPFMSVAVLDHILS